MSSQQVVGRISPTTHRVSCCDKRDMTIDILPDDVLLLVFYFDGQNVDSRLCLPSWPRLVHVCRRWRCVVFASPNFLDLRLVLTPGRRAELIDIWPPFPIIVKSTGISSMPEDYDFDAAIAVHRNRVREIDVFLGEFPSERLVSAMREPYPALTHLGVYDDLLCDWDLALPDGFLGGSAPGLQHLYMHFIRFPALPKFLLSATDLVVLHLQDMRTYISAETLLTCLAALPNLKSLTVEYQTSMLLHSDWEREFQHPGQLPPTRILLPALTHFGFRWVSRYLEVLVAHIDTPSLHSFSIAYYDIMFDVPRLGQFMRRTTSFQALNEAHVDFDRTNLWVKSLPPARSDKGPWFKISCHVPSWKLCSMARAFKLISFFPSIHVVEHLYIYGPRGLLTYWKIEIEDIRWLEIFRPFTAVKNLYLYKEIAQCIAPALQELVGERVTDVLPALESIYLEDLEPSGPVERAIGQFVAARQLLGRPVAVFQWFGTERLCID